MTKAEQQYQDMIDMYKGSLKKAEKDLKENKHLTFIPCTYNNPMCE